MIWLAVPLTLALLSLLPALKLGRSAPGSRRLTSAWGWALALNTVATVAPLSGYLAVLILPATCFGIAACVAGVAGRQAWLRGVFACPWFLVPSLIWWATTATPDQVAAYGRIPVDVLTLTLPFGMLGATAAEIMLSIHTVLRWGRSPTTIAGK